MGEKGIGALPRGRGTRLTALVLNNLGCYHRRRGQGRNALHLLKLAEEIEGADSAISTQVNLCLLSAEVRRPSKRAGHPFPLLLPPAAAVARVVDPCHH